MMSALRQTGQESLLHARSAHHRLQGREGTIRVVVRYRVALRREVSDAGYQCQGYNWVVRRKGRETGVECQLRTPE